MSVTQHKFRIENAPLDLMRVFPEAQRRLSKRHVDEIVADFDPGRVGLLHISDRGRATDAFAVVDGQHRRAALMRLGYEAWPSVVYEGLTLKEEADLFVGLNNTRHVQPIDTFHARVTAGDLVALDIIDAAHKCGWAIPRYPTTAPGQLTAVTALLRIYENNVNQEEPSSGRWAIEKVLRVVTDAWGIQDRAAVNATMLRGTDEFLRRYSHLKQFDMNGLIDRLRKYPGGATRFYATARGLLSLSRETASRAVAWQMQEVYDEKRTTRRLPAWRSGE